MWFLRRNKTNRKREILFIDARNHGHLINRKNLELSDSDIAHVASVYRNWRTGENEYIDVQGFCKSGTVKEVQVLNNSLTPGRFVGLRDDEDDFNFEERFNFLKTELENQIIEEDDLNKRITKNLSRINLKVEVNA